KWLVKSKQGIVVAGGNGQGNGINQLNESGSVIGDQVGTVYVVDSENQRVLHLFNNSASGSIIIGGPRAGNGMDHL
ncbi:unnamed protein product, partial [Rotaria sp. Silwood2]